MNPNEIRKITDDHLIFNPSRGKEKKLMLNKHRNIQSVFLQTLQIFSSLKVIGTKHLCSSHSSSSTWWLAGSMLVSHPGLELLRKVWWQVWKFSGMEDIPVGCEVKSWFHQKWSQSNRVWWETRIQAQNIWRNGKSCK